MGGRGTAGRALPQPAAANQSNLTGLAARLEDTYLDLIADPTKGAYGGVGTAYSDYVSLTDIRDKLSDVPRDQLDAELMRLLDAQVLNIAPNSDQQKLTPADRKAAIMIGGKPKHLVVFVHPEDRD
jgi:hypothetical protein